MSATDRRPLATPEELADYLQVSIRTVYDWRLDKTGPRWCKIGTRLRYRWADIDQWVEQQSAGAA